ncbi:MAG: hypothetical protein SGARI_001588 [Bacillariaceae sp.]
MQDIAPSSDLFDGDILGDELMDIYNAAVVGGGEDDVNMNDENGEKTEGAYDANPTDDGFGAFRPSTSFNDLSTLLTEGDGAAAAGAPGAAPAPGAQGQMATVVSSASLPPTQAPLAPNTAGKRKAPAGAPGTAKRTKIVRKTVIKKKVPAGSKAAAAKKAKNDTPNPLKIIPAPVASAPIAAKPVTVKKAIAAKPAAARQVSAAGSPASTKSTKAPLKITAPQNVAPAPVLSSTPTEADFKNVAQAAVSNLMMNASNGKGESAKSSEPAGKVDISTDHVKALTGSNWVSVCSGGDSPSGSNQAVADKMNNRARRQNLTPDERARQNRDRNREHARNTRLRKKAYVEELKRTLTALVSQRDAADLEKRHASQRELEQREVRFRVTEEFLKLRGRNEANPARWAAILEDNFTLTLPVTDFRGMVHPREANRQRFEQVLKGVPEIMNDSNLCSAFLQGLGKGHNDISMVYNCDRKNFFMDNCTAMLEFTASSHGATQQGAASELSMKGNVRAKFSPASNKLISVVMTFDTGIIMSQINQITHSFEHEVDAAAAAAQVAASEADAILDSLQMPHIAAPSIPNKINVNVVPPSSGSTTGSSICEKEDTSDSSSDKDDGDEEGMSTRRVLRRKD